jgi:protocadherin-15
MPSTEIRTFINPFFSSLQVNITVLDINDNAPMWRDEPYHANVVEMSPMDTDVISVSSAFLDL